MEAYERTNPSAGAGWRTGSGPGHGRRGASPSGSTTTAPRRTCTAASAQPVPRLDIAAAVADITRLDYEEPNEIEGFIASMS